MKTPDAPMCSEWPGYEHLHWADRPRIGINGLTPEGRLWQEFNHELQLRTLVEYINDTHPNFIQHLSRRLSELPAH
jgi:hypothetical protein